MHDAPDKDWTLEWLADTAGMSRTSFANVFRDVIGVTPGNYLSRWRLTLAKGLLSEGAPLKGVAQAVGYASPAALSRAYTRQFGFTPRESKRHVDPGMTASGYKLTFRPY
jgi:transcriptional regulator GlxA family with amidase domain